MSKAILEDLYNMITPNKYQRFEKIAAERTRYLTVVMENIHHDHNASAVMRTCDCFGIQDLHVIEKSHVYEIQRDIAKGAGQWIDLHQHNEGKDPTIKCLKDLKAKGYKIVATSPVQEAKAMHELNLDQPMAIVFGTEVDGISDEVKEMADDFVTIPMHGFTESFNVSVSAALMLQHLRRRMDEENIDYLLTEEEQTEIKIQWATVLLKNGSEVLKEIQKRHLDKQK
jgi:tRNA (guanosine-2'-O-)-methyltransferase